MSESRSKSGDGELKSRKDKVKRTSAKPLDTAATSVAALAAVAAGVHETLAATRSDHKDGVTPEKASLTPEEVIAPLAGAQPTEAQPAASGDDVIPASDQAESAASSEDAPAADIQVADAGEAADVQGEGTLETGAAGAQLSDERFDIIVHATPLGMTPDVDSCFFSVGELNAPLVFETVYTPIETRLVKMARRKRLHVIVGLEMFLEQAAGQFELWTGREAPRAVMEQAAREALCS